MLLDWFYEKITINLRYCWGNGWIPPEPGNGLKGGIDQGETSWQALSREMKEELGEFPLACVYQFPFTLKYEFPEFLLDKFYPNIGQEQMYYLLTPFQDGVPDPDKALDKEFSSFEWRPLKTAAEDTVSFKKQVYLQAIAHALDIIQAENWQDMVKKKIRLE